MEYNLPPWCEALRPHQLIAVHQIMHAFQEHDVVILDAPTGSGKTLIGEIISQQISGRTFYICHSLNLQDQFVKDFPHAKVLKGRSNYPTRNFPERFGGFTNLSCSDCTANRDEPSCQWCGSKSSCPYELAKFAAIQSRLAVINSSYFLTEANGPGKFSGADLIIWDECDTMENELLSNVEVEVPDWMQLGKPKKVTVRDSWAEWVDEALPKVKSRKAEFNKNQLFETEPDIKALRRVKNLESMEVKLKDLRKTLRGEEEERWVLEHDKRVKFRPVKVDTFGEEKIWRHGKKWLLMSASVISPQVLMESLGYRGTYGYVKVPSTFPPDIRKVKVKACGSMSKKTIEDSTPRLQEALREIRLQHPDERILIHSVSYSLADIILDALKDFPNVYSYTESRGKLAALDRYLGSPAATLVAPSMDRGVDLPGDACRVQVIAKVPYPNLGDKVVSARLYTRGGQAWYATQTVRTLVQMTGRGVRSKDDQCVTYILDSDFQGFYGKGGRGLFPKWWMDALEWERIRR